MSDAPFLCLSEDWRLASDGIQWIVQKRGSMDQRNGEHRWRGVGFIASDRGILLRCLHKKGVVVEPEAMRAVLSLPYRFRDWLEQRQTPSQGDFEGAESVTTVEELPRAA